MHMRALVIEDNAKLAHAIQKGLSDAGVPSDICLEGRDGEARALVQRFDVIVLDLILPDMSGLDICRSLRSRGVETPVIMLSGMGDPDDRIRGLEAGADDYMSKPFVFAELIARINAITRRAPGGSSNVLRTDTLELDLHTHEAKRGDRHWGLSSREFSLLEYLMRNPNRVLTRAEIGEHIWQMRIEPGSNIIDVYIAALRKKIERPGEKTLIHTIKNAGYRFGDAA
jgi:DNA-binding response OmpR family regulator